MLNVLLVEDDDIDAENIQRILSKCSFNGPIEKKGCHLLRSSYIRNGLDTLCSNEKIDIVLLDLNLPDGNGLDFIQSANKKGCSVPIIVLTGQAPGLNFGVELIQAGAQDYLEKSTATENVIEKSISYSINRYKQTEIIKNQSEKLKSINEELETFTYISSHDLRAPLVNLKGFSQELQKSIETVVPFLEEMMSKIDPERKIVLDKEIHDRIPKALKYIANSTEKMERLTGAILKLSRVGKIDLVMESINIKEVVQKSLDAFQYAIKEKNCSVECGPLPIITGDRNAIEQIFGNILDNALKYLDPSRPGLIKIRVYESKEYHHFSISDNGRGIADEDQHKVFEIFRRAGNVDRIPGDGMGMPYIRTLLKRLGGTIHFESKSNVGTTFYFTLPKQAR